MSTAGTEPDNPSVLTNTATAITTPTPTPTPTVAAITAASTMNPAQRHSCGGCPRCRWSRTPAAAGAPPETTHAVLSALREGGRIGLEAHGGELVLRVERGRQAALRVENDANATLLRVDGDGGLLQLLGVLATPGLLLMPGGAPGGAASIDASHAPTQVLLAPRRRDAMTVRAARPDAPPGACSCAGGAGIDPPILTFDTLGGRIVATVPVVAPNLVTTGGDVQLQDAAGRAVWRLHVDPATGALEVQKALAAGGWGTALTLRIDG